MYSRMEMLADVAGEMESELGSDISAVTDDLYSFRSEEPLLIDSKVRAWC
jgi:hypothetical protein